MGFTMSGLGMSSLGMSSMGPSASAMGRADEDERRKRLENILGLLKRKPGRVSPKGIVDLCTREGVPVTQEKNLLTVELGTEAVCDVRIRIHEARAKGISVLTCLSDSAKE